MNKQQFITPKCRRCKRRYPIIPGAELPAMVGFVLEDGTKINLCKNCIEDLGRAKQNGTADDFFKKLGL